MHTKKSSLTTWLIAGLLFLGGCSGAGKTTTAGSGNSGTGGGNGSTQNAPTVAATIASIEITSANDPLQVGSARTLVAVARDASGNVIGQATIVFNGNRIQVANVTSDGEVTAHYPGDVEITASAGGVSSATYRLTVQAVPNGLIVSQITDNQLEDSWGMNNSFSTTSRGRILFHRFEASGDESVVLVDAAGTLQASWTYTNTELDFLALGSGAGANDILATWRTDLNATHATDGIGRVNGLGAVNQEENAIADGCLFYRDSSIGGVDDNDVALYTLVNGNQVVSTAGPEDSDPVTSECEAIWIRDGELIHYDGIDQRVVSAGPFFGNNQYDLRAGQIVYSVGGEVFLVDTSVLPLSSVKLTTLGSYPHTDGRSVVWLEDNRDVVLYDIATGTSEIISITREIKNVLTLQIDGRQVIWQDANGDLFFHDGRGTDAGTQLVDPFPATTVVVPYLSDGLVTWVGQTGANTDTEIFTLL